MQIVLSVLYRVLKVLQALAYQVLRDLLALRVSEVQMDHLEIKEHLVSQAQMEIL